MNKYKAPWVNWPNLDYMRKIEDLYKVGARCDVWREFLNSDTAERLKGIKGSVIWFNRYEYFDRLICEFDSSEKTVRAVIESLMRPGHEMPVEFVRNDIYDARAWAYLPLTCFAEIDGCAERSGRHSWQHEILGLNEMPIVQFGIKSPWVVSRDCFKLAHRLKNNERYAVMTFDHPQLDRRFEGKRWAAERTFPRQATRTEMTEALFAKVTDECAKHLVTISDPPRKEKK